MSKETKTISEAASKKRGRPRVLDPLREAILKAEYPEAKTRRGIIEFNNRIRALNLLRDDPRFLWLADFKKMKAGALHAWKPSILSELGRIHDEDDMKAVALRICELKPKTKDAIGMIRQWRTGKECSASALDLTDSIIKAIREYAAAHTDTTWQQIRGALETATAIVNETEQKESFQDP